MSMLTITISIRRPALSWLVSLIGRGLHRYRRGHEFFSGFLFATAKVAYIHCDDHPSFNSSHSAVYIYDFHVFNTTSFIKNRVWIGYWLYGDPQGTCCNEKVIAANEKNSWCK